MRIKNFLVIEKYGHTLFGRIALEEGLITIEKLLEAIKTQHRNPNYKIGEILTLENHITKYQVQHILEIQQKLYADDDSLPLLNDFLLRGLVNFQTIDIGISKENLQKAEETRQQAIVLEKKIPYLQDLFIEMELIALDDVLQIYEDIGFFFGKCPRCKRDFKLYQLSVSEQVPCPVCWDMDLVTGISADLPVPQVSLQRAEEDKEQRKVLYSSPQFLAIYKILKSLQPVKKEEILIMTTGDDSIAQVFDQLTVQYTGQEKIESVEISAQELKQLEQGEEDPEQEPEAMTTPELIQEEKLENTILVGWDLARVRRSLFEKWVTTAEIAYAFYYSLNMDPKQRKSIIQILSEQKNFSGQQKSFLNKIRGVRIPSIPFKMSPIDDKVYRHILEYELLFCEELKKVMEIQLKLNIVGIATTLKDTLHGSKVLGADMIDGIYALCMQQLQEQKQEKQISKSVINSNYSRRLKRNYKMALVGLILTISILLAFIVTSLPKTTTTPSSSKGKKPMYQKIKIKKTKTTLKAKKKVFWHVHFNTEQRILEISVEQETPARGSIQIERNHKEYQILSIQALKKLQVTSSSLLEGEYRIRLLLPNFKDSNIVVVPPGKEELLQAHLKTTVPKLLVHIEQIEKNTGAFLQNFNTVEYIYVQQRWMAYWEEMIAAIDFSLSYKNPNLHRDMIQLKQLDQKLRLVVQNLVFYAENNIKIKEKTFVQILKASQGEKSYAIVKKLQKNLEQRY